MSYDVLSRTVWVTDTFVGYHDWPDAPEERDYLRETHRHRFGVRVELPVAPATPDDREVEFHDLLAWLDPVARDSIGAGGSCEQMAERIAARAVDYWHRQATVSVDEDGENGATVSASEEVPF